MTVKELIKMLEKIEDKDLEVGWSDYEYGFDVMCGDYEIIEKNDYRALNKNKRYIELK